MKLLQHYLEVGDEVFEPKVFETTAFYRFVAESIDVFGNHFEAVCERDIERVARRFVAHFKGDPPPVTAYSGESRRGYPPIVRPIQFSDCYQIIDGHHRLAIALARGHSEVVVASEGKPVRTPLQELLLDVLWTNGTRELYQPVHSPELQTGWGLFRGCTDRLEMMLGFLDDNALLPPRGRTFLDVAMSYGWFVAEMKKLGFQAHGVERDPAAVRIGQVAYGLQEDEVTRANCVRFLQDTGTYDVVSCLSVLHHFALGKGCITAPQLIKLLDKVTGQVLFLDTGEGHERWFRDSLPDWNPDFIETLVKSSSSFKRAYRLGKDQDGGPPFEGNYRRTLFAFMR